MKRAGIEIGRAYAIRPSTSPYDEWRCYRGVVVECPATRQVPGRYSYLPPREVTGLIIRVSANLRVPRTSPTWRDGNLVFIEARLVKCRWHEYRRLERERNAAQAARDKVEESVRRRKEAIVKRFGEHGIEVFPWMRRDNQVALTLDDAEQVLEWLGGLMP